MPATSVTASVLLGFGANLALLWSLGAQNTFVIRQGLTGRHVGMVAAICIASDAALIGSGITGMTRLMASHQWVGTVLAVAGASFLYGYAMMAARRALQPGPGIAGAPTGRHPGAVRTALAIATITWLNPHVLLETVVVLGTAATAYGSPGQWWFGFGAVIASTIWYLALGYGVRALSPAFARPMTWQVLEGLTAVVMAVLATTVLYAAF